MAFLMIGLLLVMVGFMTLVAVIKIGIISLSIFLPSVVLYCLLFPNRTPKEENKVTVTLGVISIIIAFCITFS